MAIQVSLTECGTSGKKDRRDLMISFIGAMLFNPVATIFDRSSTVGLAVLARLTLHRR